jgi:hypothetical protein
VFGIGLRLGSLFGQRAKVMARDLSPTDLTHRRNGYLHHDLNQIAFLVVWDRVRVRRPVLVKCEGKDCFL